MNGSETVDRHSRIGRLIWVAVVVVYPLLQWWVMAAWPVPYSFLHHTVSDLGYTTCGEEMRPGGILATCSPRHLVYNVVGCLISAGVLTGGVLQRRRWGDGRMGAAISWLFIIIGVSGIGTAVVPGDVSLTWHTLLALPLFLGQLAVLMLLAMALRKTERINAAVIGAVLAVSVVGTFLFVAALAGHGYVGVSERLSAETFYVALLAMGIKGPR